MRGINATLLLCLLAAIAVASRSGAAESPAGDAVAGAHLIDGRIFVEGGLIRFDRPPGAEGQWVLLDDRGAAPRQGSFRPGEEAIYLGDLQPGAYFLFWGLRADETPSSVSGPTRRASFLVLPDKRPAVEDHYFAANQPGMVSPAAEGEKPALTTEQRFVLDALARLGIHRLRTSFARDRVRKGAEAWDFRGIETLLNHADSRAVRLIALLGRTEGVTGAGAETRDLEDFNRLRTEAETDVEYVQALLRRFGFKFDVFALWPDANTLSFPAAPHLFVMRAEPVYRVLRERSPYSSISLGGVAADINDPRAPARKDFLEGLFLKGAGLFDVLDINAEGSLLEARAFHAAVDAVTNNTPVADKPRAVGRAGIGANTDSILDQRRQAIEMVKKIAWFRHKGYHYFALGSVLDIASPGASGVQTREQRTGGIGLFAAPGLYPRVAAGAVCHAVRHLAGARPVDTLKYESAEVEIYGFERGGQTILTAWAPLRPDDTRTEKRMVVELFWPDDLKAEAFDMLGRTVTDKHLKNVDEATRIKRLLIVDVEPVYLTIPAPASAVRW